PAALGVRLEAEHAIEPGAVHAAALDEDVSRAARDLAADDDAAVAVLHLAVAHDDVLDRRVDAAAVGVSSRLERDAVVAGVEAAALDQDVAARFGIAPVVVRSVAPDREAADVRAENRMHFPHRRVHDRHAFDQYVPAAIGLDEIRAQVAAVAEDAPLDRHAVRGHGDEARARAAGI